MKKLFIGFVEQMLTTMIGGLVLFFVGFALLIGFNVMKAMDEFGQWIVMFAILSWLLGNWIKAIWIKKPANVEVNDETK